MPRQTVWSSHPMDCLAASTRRHRDSTREEPVIDRHQRAQIAAFGGIATFVLFFAGWAAWAGPGLPDLGSAKSVAAWFAQHKDACRIAAILGSLSLPTMIAFDVSLYGVLREAEAGDGIVTRAFFAAALMTIVFDL